MRKRKSFIIIFFFDILFWFYVLLAIWRLIYYYLYRKDCGTYEYSKFTNYFRTYGLVCDDIRIYKESLQCKRDIFLEYTL